MVEGGYETGQTEQNVLLKKKMVGIVESDLTIHWVPAEAGKRKMSKNGT